MKILGCSPLKSYLGMGSDRLYRKDLQGSPENPGLIPVHPRARKAGRGSITAVSWSDADAGDTNLVPVSS